MSKDSVITCKEAMLNNGLQKMTPDEAMDRFKDAIMFVNLTGKLAEGEFDNLNEFIKRNCKKTHRCCICKEIVKSGRYTLLDEIICDGATCWGEWFLENTSLWKSM